MKFIIQYLSFTLALLLGTSSFAADFLALSADGVNGSSGMRGIDYGSSRALDGYRGFNGNKGGNGSDGLNGGNATRATDGSPAGDILLILSRSEINSQIINYGAQVNGNSATSGSFDLTNNTRVTLSAAGGRGGNGAPGGSGQAGGNGGEGGDASAISPRSGDGGDGGDGGIAGKSSNGANGANGGRIVVRVPVKDQDLLQLIPFTINVSGGAAGRAPLQRGNPGQGGRGGNPGDDCFYNRENQRQCVSRGFTGRSGIDGTPIFDHPIGGTSGQDGSYSFEVF